MAQTCARLEPRRRHPPPRGLLLSATVLRSTRCTLNHLAQTLSPPCNGVHCRFAGGPTSLPTCHPSRRQRHAVRYRLDAVLGQASAVTSPQPIVVSEHRGCCCYATRSRTRESPENCWYSPCALALPLRGPARCSSPRTHGGSVCALSLRIVARAESERVCAPVVRSLCDHSEVSFVAG
jgi:hypothetical protein